MLRTWPSRLNKRNAIADELKKALEKYSKDIASLRDTSRLRALLREDGPARLYRGYALTILRAGPVAGVILPTFEVVLPYLEAVL